MLRTIKPLSARASPCASPGRTAGDAPSKTCLYPGPAGRVEQGPVNENERAPSRTAVLVRQGRAAADASVAAGRFSDPVAMQLLRAEERTPVDAVRVGVPPQGRPARTRYESVRARAEVMVARTGAIDEALCACPPRQLVILGAGLDSRAWRLPQLARTDVWEVDHPACPEGRRPSAAFSSRSHAHYNHYAAVVVNMNVRCTRNRYRESPCPTASAVVPP
ncbi:class I SAM-dependent methyltransferase [Streptomyces sp. NPDC058441]|uniref:class I SAM-dependent methyltransferase n=1 Tax=Streptomyces sp. NPDC058441 TaxID=3346502 RepID=UPI00365F3894